MIPPLVSRFVAQDRSDRAAYAFVRFLRLFADMFFASRYGHRAVVLEAVAAVPGKVRQTVQHLKSLRRREADHRGIRILPNAADCGRIHLVTLMEIVRPSGLERLLVLLAHCVFYTLYFLFYVVSPGTAYRVVGYLAEEAVRTYTDYLACVENGTYDDIAAPGIAIDYWRLDPDAGLREVIIAIGGDHGNRVRRRRRHPEQVLNRQ